jgi:DNA modification methylase
VSETIHREKPSADQGRKRTLARTEGSGAPGDLAKGFKEKSNLRPNSDLPEETQRALGAYIANGSVVDRAGGVSGTSIFDPVLCELMYEWFCPPGGQVLDPFAGGSVRGIVASIMGLDYWGCDLRPEQIEANQIQAKNICLEHLPTWVCGDSIETIPSAPQADFIFTCPPYGDLEVYSDDSRDISTMDYNKFIETLDTIMRQSCEKLNPGGMACMVVGEFRDKQGYYHGFVTDTVKMLQQFGMRLYNDIILVTAVGSLPIRVSGQFEKSRKVGKTHQNVLVFKKEGERKVLPGFALEPKPKKQKEKSVEEPKLITEEVIVKVTKNARFDGTEKACPGCGQVEIFSSQNNWLCPNCSYDLMG